jgi:general L-amino acid transport system permease protein
MATDLQAAPPPARAVFYNDPKVRSIAYQIALCVVVGLLVYGAGSNVVTNLQKAKIASGFGFWNDTAGFDISQTLIPFSSAASTYGTAFWVGLLNTLLVAGLGVIFATILGFTIGIMRLSKNWLVSKVATGYVELIRNLPLLLQLLFWYNAVLKALPDIRDSISLTGGAVINNRGLFLPNPLPQHGFGFVEITFLIGIIGAVAYYRWARKRQMATGQQAPILWVTLGFVILAPLAVFFATGMPLQFDFPKSGRFNISGGIEVLPEFFALLVGLVVYTAAFIAEVVRAGILAVSHGQTEASYSLGLRPGPTLRLIVVPQAMRVIIPPLTSQYLNLTKNSSLAVAIGYPDLVQVFTGTVLNQTGQAVEVVAITMLVYLTISLTTSLLMNIYNARMALVER